MRNSASDFYPKCSATCIGSLPFLDAREAMDAVAGNVSEMPFWPQLPKRDLREGMLLQFAENLLFLEIKNNSVVLRQDYEQHLEQFFTAVINRDLDFFSISAEYAAGLSAFFDSGIGNSDNSGKFLKGQITGPFTFASPIKAADGNSLLFDAQLMDAVVSGLAMKAAWQIREFRRLGKRAIIFIDEPYLACFGSGFTAINGKDVTATINHLIEMIGEPDCLIGLHCCSNTDWSLLLDTDIDIISFDAFSFLERFLLFAPDLKRFLARGSSIAWGIVPTTEFKAQISAADLVTRFQDGLNALENKGLEKKDIIAKSIITPSCGMGSLSVEICESVLKLLAQTSKQLKEEFVFD